MNNISNIKTLKPEELVSKSDSELLQLKLFYENKIKQEKEFDVFKKIKLWLKNNKRKALYIFLLGMIILVISLYFGFTKNLLYAIPAMIIFSIFMFLGMIFEKTNLDLFYKNINTLDLLLKVRIESKESKKARPSISKNAMKVFDVLKEGEANQTVLLKKLKEKGTPLSEKTLRKYLNEDLKEIVSCKEAPFNSISRSQSKTKVYFIKTGK